MNDKTVFSLYVMTLILSIKLIKITRLIVYSSFLSFDDVLRRYSDKIIYIYKYLARKPIFGQTVEY